MKPTLSASMDQSSNVNAIANGAVKQFDVAQGGLEH
jgi:hypothetical protein